MNHALGAAAGLVADLVLGEPPASVHPVAGFGRVMQAVEERWYADGRPRGAAHALAGLAIGAVSGRAVRSTTVATWSAVAGRDLRRVATEIGDALQRDDLDGARRLVPSLVGRDPSRLDEGDIARAVVESVAENTVDAVVAPALWAALAGAPGALAHRAVNTMDAMVGHHSDRYERYGWAAARLDDVAAWVPARVTVGLVAACRPSAARRVVDTARRDGPAHPSPNGGLVEAAFAAALDLRLGGTNRYGDRVEVRPPLGSGRSPEASDIAGAVRLSRDVTVAVAGLLAVAGLARRRSSRPARRS
ncbi:MAG TPA: adenosylcobinamide-phosphate synthase CbiB [Acidimicrobiales bacterium]|nr:adenosylcobinamide-phosphate synthase CbiB [Acidimicrobiales bacterium]